MSETNRFCALCGHHIVYDPDNPEEHLRGVCNDCMGELGNPGYEPLDFNKDD